MLYDHPPLHFKRLKVPEIHEVFGVDEGLIGGSL